MIEESDRGVGAKRAHTKSEHNQAIVVLMREAIQYSEHGFPPPDRRDFPVRNCRWSPFVPLFNASVRTEAPLRVAQRRDHLHDRGWCSGSLPLASTPEGFKERVTANIKKWNALVDEVGITLVGAQ